MYVSSELLLKRAFCKHSHPSVSPGNWFQESPHKVGPGLGFPAGGVMLGLGQRQVCTELFTALRRWMRTDPGSVFSSTERAGYPRESKAITIGRVDPWKEDVGPSKAHLHPACPGLQQKAGTCITWLLGVRWENLFLYPLLS